MMIRQKSWHFSKKLWIIESSYPLWHTWIIREKGAQTRNQSPLLKYIDDDSEICSTLWKDLVRSGVIPYQLFVER